MPAATVTKEVVLERLLGAFRDRGFDGASLTELSDATGLGKSSLYHHFPGGKVDMAQRVLEHLEAELERSLFEPLRSDRSPDAKLAAMLDTLSDFYAEGRRACLLERLCASVDGRSFRRPLARVFEKWIGAVEELALEAGVPKAPARSRAEDLVVRIEGALIVCAGTGNTKVFTRTIDELRRSLLAR
jgi:TetR/AcrR family transcriptional regulator, lmrAB and yxaGH operons repressor